MGRTTYNVSRAAFVADPSSLARLNGRQIDWPNVGSYQRINPGTPPVTIVVGVAGAAQGATTVPVGALTAAIPNGTTIDLGANKFLRLTAAAAAGATSLTTAALPTALVSGDTGTYAGTAGTGSKYLPAGTAIGDLASGGKLRPRVATSNPAIGFLETDAREDSETDARTGYGVIVGGVLYENMLPDAVAGALPAGIKTEVNTAGVGTGFAFQTYGDNRS